MIIKGTDYNKTYTQAHSMFMDYSNIILLEFRKGEDNKLATLVAETTGARKQIEWLKRAKEFYTFIIRTPKVMPQIVQYNITAEKLNAAPDKVETVENAKPQYINLKRKAEDATSWRNVALIQLAVLMRKLQKVPEVAFKPNPQFLKKCGIRGYRVTIFAGKPIKKINEKNLKD